MNALEKAYAVKLELYAENPKQTDIVYYSGDKNAYPLSLRLVKEEDPFAIEPGVEAQIVFRLPDGTWQRGVAQIVDAACGLLRYDIRGSEIAQYGVVRAHVELLSAEERLTWQGFSFSVMKQGGEEQPTGEEASWARDVTQDIMRLEQESFAGMEYDGLTLTMTNAAGEVVADVEITSGGTGSTRWGSIPGNIGDQVDLKEALDEKASVVIGGKTFAQCEFILTELED